VRPRAAVLLVLTATAVAANFTNYGALIPLLRTELAVGSGAIGLMSTLLYVGIGATYLLGGMLADRAGSRQVLLVALALIGCGGVAMAFVHELWWVPLGSGLARRSRPAAAMPARWGAWPHLARGCSAARCRPAQPRACS
jgi:MFS family permease